MHPGIFILHPNLHSEPVPPRPPFHPLFLLPHAFSSACSPHTSLCPPCPLPPTAAPAGALHVLVILVLPPEVWGLRGAGWGSGWPGQAVGQSAGLALLLEEVEGVLVTLCCQKVTLWLGGPCCVASWHGAMSFGLACLEMSVQRSGAVLPTASALSWQAALGPKLVSFHSGCRAGTPCTEPDPGLTVWGRGAPSWARPGASGAFLIISAWVTWGLL